MRFESVFGLYFERNGAGSVISMWAETREAKAARSAREDFMMIETKNGRV